ncbi:hypothetical protein [Chitinophaga sp. CF418]|uniref:hypothetical protein n=1 Tax=Chitinophaga sp. CF418 TaxID=1855287 RepID=UPI00092224BC|nr:hypothetical protein [Chitinophaga sp. CF418]SHM14762.1 hypothetical protein SAMN05216311_101718 [Chitinophaga sp. CF418]
MKTLAEVKSLFEHKSYDVRSDFINEYDFKDDHFEYYRQFIMTATTVRDHLYLSDLIDLAGWLNINDKELRDRYYNYLFTRQHYVVKLAALDYFKHCSKELLPATYEQDLASLSHKRTSDILRNQIQCNLVLINTEKKDLYLLQLLEMLTRTNDWRSCYRVLMNLKYCRFDSKDKLVIYDHISELAGKKNLGEGVEGLLKEMGTEIRNNK